MQWFFTHWNPIGQSPTVNTHSALPGLNESPPGGSNVGFPYAFTARAQDPVIEYWAFTQRKP